MALSNEMRSLLMDGEAGSIALKVAISRAGGSVSATVAWRKHREELLAACPAGKRPFWFWFGEKRLRFVPHGDYSNAKMIRALQLYRDAHEKNVVLRRLEAHERGRRAVREAIRRVA